jgi:SAM-dependent methyltransferase
VPNVLSALKRNANALRKLKNETPRDYRARLLFELGRRSNQFVHTINPRGSRERRLEKLVGPAGVWPHLEQYQFNVLTALGLEPHHTVLDIGCGPITVGVKLISYLQTGHYVGLDARAAPLEEAYRRVADHKLAHKNPVLIHSESFGKEELGGRQFDYIWMSQLSYHLNDEITAQLFAYARTAMARRSVFLLDIIDPEIELTDDSWCGFAYHVRPLAFYEAMAQRFGLTLETCGRIRDYGYPPRLNLGANIVLRLSKADTPAS